MSRKEKPTAPFNTDRFDKALAMEQVDNDVEFLLELMDDLLEQLEEAKEELKELAATENHEDFWKAAHTSKGPALNLGCNALAWACKKAEFVGKALHKCAKDGLDRTENKFNSVSFKGGDVQVMTVAELKAAQQEAMEEIAKEGAEVAKLVADAKKNGL